MGISTEIAGNLTSMLEQGTARVGVVGLGYVGLPLALAFARKGLRATGFDVDPVKVGTLSRGESYIHHIPASEIRHELEKDHFKANSDFSELHEMDAILICVPTPLDDHREPDLSFIRNTAAEIREHLRPGQLVVLESTTYPGTTEEELLPLLEQSGLRCPVSEYSTDGNTVRAVVDDESDFLLAFSPEREDPGNKNFRTSQLPKVIGGVNGASALAARALYQNVFERTIIVSSSRVAEMTKLLENIYRCVNIALVNELKLLCLRMGIDIWEVIETAKTKPFGFTAFYPGPGLGGHCIPIDPFYLSWKAREYEMPTRFIELAGEINSAMPEHVVATLANALNERGQCVRDSKVLVMGIAYKRDVDDPRESPALRIIELLQQRGAHVDYHDPFFPHMPKMRRYDFTMTSVEPTPENLAVYDAVLIATDHSSSDYEAVVRNARLVVDTRNATRCVTDGRERIVLC